jgi:glycosyltransferase involved in cell wall biosynthesis
MCRVNIPAVSVLMPCYNAAPFLPLALQSLSVQTWEDFEIVAVDDGSTDGTAALLGSWAHQESRLRVIYGQHAGIVETLNRGLAACQAPLVARMDADDWSHPRRLEKQVMCLQSRPEIDLLSCQVEGLPAGSLGRGFALYLEWANGLLEDAEIRREIFVESPLPHPSVVFRRRVVLEAGGYQEHAWPEDYDLWLRLYLTGARFARLPEVLLGWRDHPQRLTRCDVRYSLDQFFRLKAHYLQQGPLVGRDAVFIWGAGQMGRYLSRHLLAAGVPITAFVDIDPRKQLTTRRSRPVLSPDAWQSAWAGFPHPVLLVAVGTRGARTVLRPRLSNLGLLEGQDWWFAA